jgi:hypothetical protein
MCAEDCNMCRWCATEGKSDEVAAAREAMVTLLDTDDE